MSDELLEAIQTRDVNRVAALLTAGVDPNEPGQSRYGGSRQFPLQAAIGELEEFDEDATGKAEPAGPLESVILLLRHGAKVRSADPSQDGDPLMIAAFMNHVEAVRLLLANGADPNVRDNVGDGPLRICADKGHLEIARLLLLCGATKTIDEWGGDGAMTALGHACRRLNVDMVKLLMDYGADPHAQDVDGWTPFVLLQRYFDSSEDPTIQSRVREIRALLGEPKTSV